MKIDIKKFTILVEKATHSDVKLKGEPKPAHTRLELTAKPYGGYHIQLLAEDGAGDEDGYPTFLADYKLVEFLWNHRKEFLELAKKEGGNRGSAETE